MIPKSNLKIHIITSNKFRYFFINGIDLLSDDNKLSLIENNKKIIKMITASRSQSS